MRKALCLSIVCLSVGSSAFAQHKVTITPVSSLKPAPVQSVARQALDIMPGVVQAAPRQTRPVFDPSNMIAPKTRVPLPTFNQTSVSYCDIAVAVGE